MARWQTPFLLVILLALAAVGAVQQWQRSRDPRLALRRLPEGELETRAAAHDPLACVELADRHQHAGHVAEAARILDRAVGWQPRLVEAQKQLGVCLARLGDRERSAAHLVRAAALAPRDWETFFYLGSVYQASGRYLDGASAFEKAGALNPHFASSFFSAGECYASATLFEPAAAAFRRALALDPANPEAHFLLGRSYWWQGRLDEARREVAAAVRRQPDDAAYREMLGFIYADLPDTDANRRTAVEQLSHAIALNPLSGTARYRLGTLYRRMERWDEAVAQWEAAAARQPRRPETRIELAQGYKRLGRRREAAQQFAVYRSLEADALKRKTLGQLRREAVLRSGDAEAHYVLGVFYQEQLHDARQACEQYREALRIAPGYAPARKRLAEVSRR